MKKLSTLGKSLNKQQQLEIIGGIKPVKEIVCLSPYLTMDNTCSSGYHLHPQGHCICCRN